MERIDKVTHEFTRLKSGKIKDKITRENGTTATHIYSEKLVEKMIESTIRLMALDNVKHLKLQAEITREIIKTN